MDEQTVETGGPTVGARLKAARTKKKMSLEDVAAQTRIPQRHLESLEESAWDRLPAPTYTIGFAKAYAGAVGLDRAEVSEQLREELGGHRYPVSTPEVFEPADPARSMPKGLVLGAIVAVLLLVVLMSWLNERSLGGGETPEVNATVDAPANPNPATPPPATPQGPVVLSVTEPVWLQVYEKGGATYFSGILNPGNDFTVPPSATAPLLKTAKSEGLTIKVGTATAPPVGPAATLVSDVSLLPADLLRGGAVQPAPAPAAVATPPPAPRAAPAARRPAPASRPTSPPPPAAEPAATAEPPAEGNTAP